MSSVSGPPSAGGGSSTVLSPAAFTDTADLGAWYSADNPLNTVNANTGVITTVADKSGNGRDFTPSTGKLIKRYSEISGQPTVNFASGMTAVSALTLPLKGGMTFFAVMKVISTNAYQNIFAPASGADPTDVHFFWDQPSNKWQFQLRTQGTAVAGRWVTVICHFFNSGGSMWTDVWENGANIAADTISTITGHPMPGTVGVPVNYTLNQFRRGDGLPYTSLIAEWGFYNISKKGNQQALEDYLRAKYGTW